MHSSRGGIHQFHCDTFRRPLQSLLMDAHTLECLDFCKVREVLARYAATGLGKRLAETIRPNARLELVRRWLRQVQDLQQLSREQGLPPFGGVTDVRGIVRNCAPPLRVSVEEMSQLGDALAGTHNLATYLAKVTEELKSEIIEKAGQR